MPEENDPVLGYMRALEGAVQALDWEADIDMLEWAADSLRQEAPEHGVIPSLDRKIQRMKRMQAALRQKRGPA